MKNVLVVVDMQKKFIKECGAYDIVPFVADLIEKRRAEGYEILLTLDKSGGKLCEEISASNYGWKIYKKHSYGCKRFILDLAERRPDKIEFAGVCTDICVIANVMGVMVFLPECDITVNSKCCASTKNGHAAALRVMEACKINVK